VFVVKLEPTNGDPVWAKRFGGTSADRGLGIAADSGGNAVVIGRFSGTVNFGAFTRSASGPQDLFIAKYDSLGNNQWVVTSAGSATFDPKSVVVNGNGEVAVTGGFYGNASVGGGLLVAPVTSAIFVAKFDSGGNHRWSRAFGGGTGSSDMGMGVALDSEGEVYVSGIMRSAFDFGGGWLFGGVTDAFVAKFGSAAGEYRWANRYAGPTEYDAGNCIGLNEAAGDVIVGGKFTGSIDFGSSVGVLSAAGGGNTDGFLVKVQR
jgi:hypothetical protein